VNWVGAAREAVGYPVWITRVGGLAKPWRLVRLVAVALALLLWAERTWSTYTQVGLFMGLGYDFGFYIAQVAALWSDEPSSMYRLDVLDKYHQGLSIYTTNPSWRLPVGPVAYPPLFAWLLTPFTWPSPPLGFALWTIVSLLALLHLARRVAGFFPVRERVWAMLVVAASPAVLAAFYQGQPVILLACAVAEFYLAVRAGRDFRGGLWLSCLLFKPQYGIMFALLLLWKRRWATTAGAALGVLAILGGSVLVAGLPALLAYPTALGDMSSFRGGAFTFPEFMVNWRALVLNFLPGVGNRSGLLLTLALGALTMLAVLLAWRGPWVAHDRRFPARMTMLLLGTVLANYHSHVHGLVLIAVPLASLLGEGRLARPTRVIIIVALALSIAVPAIGRLTSLMLPELRMSWSQLFPLLTLACFGSLVLEDRLREPPRVVRRVWSALRCSETLN
jgi:hypothetical protein